MSALMWVDDKRDPPPGWTLARTITEAVRLLATRDWAVVSVDHDISYDVEVPGEDGQESRTVEVDSPETFEPVVRYLALLPAARRPEVVVHSANPAAEPLFRAILAEADHISESI